MSDVYGDHAISCAIGGGRIARQGHLRDMLFQTAQQAQLGPKKEADAVPWLGQAPSGLSNTVLIPFLIPFLTHGTQWEK